MKMIVLFVLILQNALFVEWVDDEWSQALKEALIMLWEKVEVSDNGDTSSTGVNKRRGSPSRQALLKKRGCD